MIDGMKQRRKKKRHVRERDWETHGDSAFTHDLKRHRRTNTALPQEAQTLSFDENVEANAIVIGHTKKWATVEWNGEQTLARTDDLVSSAQTTLLAPGDRVRVETREGELWIVGLRPRTTRLSRLAIEQSAVAEQVIAANVDVLVIVTTPVQPMFKPSLVDRFLIVAQLGGVAPIVCMNKADLSEDMPGELAILRELGVTVLETSCETGQNIGALRARLEGTLSVLAGQSGVGKTSLLNVLDPSLDLATQTVSASTEKGRHTTTSARLFHLAGGIDIIDTPGIRQLGLWKVTEAHLTYLFPEMAEAAAACKFRNCTHTHEPDCAVRAGVDEGTISRQRYKSYLRIREDLQERAEKY
jgi:ribosome biogenesis GTPase